MMPSQASLLLVATLLFSLVPTVDSKSPSPLLQDAPGDVRGEAATGPVPIQEGTFDHIDLTSFAVEEQLDEFLLTLGVVDIDPQGQIDGPRFEITFTHHSTEFRIRADFNQGALSGLTTTPDLERRPVGGVEWDYAEGLAESSLDLDLPGAVVRVPRAALTDEDGAPPFPGRALEKFKVVSRDQATRTALVGNTGSLNEIVQFKDQMPDGEPESSFPVNLGTPQSGSIRIGADRPSRSSNGEETTYVFVVNATNVDVEPHTYSVTTTGVPLNWNVTIPIEVVTLQPRQRVALPIVVATPFFHDHGGGDEFSVTVRDAFAEIEQATVVLGVVYVDPPQPTGHHPILTLHSSGVPVAPGTPVAEGDGVKITMSTVPEDPDRPSFPARAFGIEAPSPAESAYRWCVRLDPSLAVGLDFDLQRQGAAALTLRSQTPMTGSLSGAFHVVYPEEKGTANNFCYGQRPYTEIALLPKVEVDLKADQAHGLELLIQGTPAGDFLPFGPGRDLYLELTFESSRPAGPTAADAPLLVPGGTLALPLAEYHDPIPEPSGEALSRLTIIGENSMRRAPGTIAIAEIRLAETSVTHDILVMGANQAWASLRPGPSLSAGEDTFFLVVDVPSDATPGSVASLIVQVTPRDAPLEASYTRFVVEVDLASTDDDRELLEALPRGAGRNAAAPTWSAVILTVLAAAIASGRRRYS